MKYFTSAYDVADVPSLIDDAIALKKDPHAFPSLGKNKTLGLVFMNPSLRTRLSVQKAAQQLGLNILLVNATIDGWSLESGDGAMNGTTVEHIREAAAVMGEYCDIIGVRSFPSLTDREKDDQERVMLQWMKYSNKPVLSLESATRHPLQSLADMMTIAEHKVKSRPKVVLTWAPHVKPVPQAVANSFSEWIQLTDAEFVIACPQEAMLNPDFTKGTTITHNQVEALTDADFVYAKSWSSWMNYGQFVKDDSWLLTPEKLLVTNRAKVMHCLPVRRDVELLAQVLESDQSLVVEQAANRVPAAQAVLKKMLETNFPVQKTNSVKAKSYDKSY